MANNLKDGDEGEFEIVEGSITYKLRYKLHKSRLTIEDMDGNTVSIDKRKGRIAIDRHNTNVDWHRE